ncbi:helix-turn-helix domain-containing protein [Streptomyces flaveolus]|uniref:helix-turn-helix transcriptional regulator n=1 Tax=Streptomyces flaveolus TaxID=67297 RepID=UPI0033AB2F03
MERQPLASSQEIADYLGIPKKTLYAWHYKGTGPKLLKVGRHLKGRWSDVDKWLNDQETEAA